MKKIIIACAVILAGILSSCGDTNYCYELTTTVNLFGVSTTETSHVWGTSNELDAVIAETKSIFEQQGIADDAIVITYKRVQKSMEECDD